MLSIVINVKNAANHIEQTLTSLNGFEEIILLDNFSTDSTLDIVKQFKNVIVYQQQFCGMGKLRNIAAGYAKNDWVFFIDGDEVLSYGLYLALAKITLTSGCVYAVKRHNYYANYYVNSSSWENDWVVRLYNKKQTQYSDSMVHESVVTSNLKVIKVNSGFIYHFPYQQVSQLIDKMQNYSNWYIVNYQRSAIPSPYTILFRTFLTFLKCYFLKRGFLDGFSGFIISSYNAIGVFTKYNKLYESYNQIQINLMVKVETINQLEALVNNINKQDLLPQKVLVILSEKTYNTLYDKFLILIKRLCIISAVIVQKIDQDITTVLQLQQISLQQNVYLVNNMKIHQLKEKFANSNKQLFSEFTLFLENNLTLSDCSYLKKLTQKIKRYLKVNKSWYNVTMEN